MNEEEEAKGSYVFNDLFDEEEAAFYERERHFQLFNSQLDDLANKKRTKEVHKREIKVWIEWNTFVVRFYKKKIAYYQGTKEYPNMMWFVESKWYSNSLSYAEMQVSNFKKNLVKLFMIALDLGLQLKVVE